MKSCCLLFLGCLLLTTTLLAQSGNEDLKTQLIVRDLERESRPARSVPTGPKVIGDPYLTTYWNKGTVTLYREDKTFNLTAIKYDVANFTVDVLINKEQRALDGSIIRTFHYTDSVTQLPHHFVNGKNFERDSVPIRGFLEK